ncbi:MAG TPA: diacylglycerol kinase family protein [Candidatus Saccharimonadales bacterium]|nr:diacylglycerol kinase family protein [Candidatus Saccharimonadales bacterium]
MNFKKFKKSFGFALAGIDYALNSDQNLVIHFIVAFLVIIASILMGLTALEMSILGLTIMVVITAELLNTSIEKAIDSVTKEHRTDIKIAKDVASGMVLITAMGSVIIGFLIFLPHILKFFR